MTKEPIRSDLKMRRLLWSLRQRRFVWVLSCLLVRLLSSLVLSGTNCVIVDKAAPDVLPVATAPPNTAAPGSVAGTKKKRIHKHKRPPQPQQNEATDVANMNVVPRGELVDGDAGTQTVAGVYLSGARDFPANNSADSVSTSVVQRLTKTKTLPRKPIVEGGNATRSKKKQREFISLYSVWLCCRILILSFRIKGDTDACG